MKLVCEVKYEGYYDEMHSYPFPVEYSSIEDLQRDIEIACYTYLNNKEYKYLDCTIGNTNLQVKDFIVCGQFEVPIIETLDDWFQHGTDVDIS